MYNGIWPGTVIDREDPEKLGRIRVRVPQIYGAEEAKEKISDDSIPWALPCFPSVGADSGIVFVPEIDAGVWVMFIGGDPRYPVWLGCWMSKMELVVDYSIGHEREPMSYVIKSPKKKKIIFNDTPENESIEISDSKGLYYMMSTSNKMVLELAGESKETIAKTVIVTAAVGFTVTAAAVLFTAAAFTATVAGIAVITAASVVLGNQLNAQKLCNKTMMDLFNSHTHLYNPGPGSPTPTATPQQVATEDTHTTKDTRSS